MDSVLGNHCTDFTNFERTADLKSSSLSKFVKNSTSNTAIPRILEKEKGAECEKSCREQVAPESLQSPTATPRIFEEENQFESKSQAALESKRLDSSTAQNLKPAKPSYLKIQSIQSGLDASF
ncbi:hypothetical protein [Helicobacter canis]|uniref:Uncharacterized protein n=1 Tax=Helicobacter canis NCTC 12740 TaxID=1357399 RepID=V8CJ86_9HELI|nr:hypothetical protein [Helicobacter canis]ETD27152.1 hypothetical protein HMPREF2087_00060 [Helicobacter canis NCTC 12740]